MGSTPSNHVCMRIFIILSFILPRPRLRTYPLPMIDKPRLYLFDTDACPYCELRLSQWIGVRIFDVSLEPVLQNLDHFSGVVRCMTIHPVVLLIILKLNLLNDLVLLKIDFRNIVLHDWRSSYRSCRQHHEGFNDVFGRNAWTKVTHHIHWRK